MQNGKLQIAIVGCGDMGRRHAAGWSALPGARVAAVVDSSNERACALAEALGAEGCFNDYRQMLAMPGLDAISVCIPTAAHAEVSIAAAQAGLHVFCEKPIALTLDDADRMIAAARDNNVKLGIGFIRRHSPVMHRLRQCLAAGEFGRPVFYQAVDVRSQRPKLMMHNAALTAGAVVDMGVHVYDGWGYVFDSEPLSVYAQGLKLADGRPELAGIADIAYDSAAVTVRYRSGDIGSFTVTWGLPLGVNPPDQPDRLFGAQALVEVDYGIERQQLRINRRGEWETLLTVDLPLYSAEIEAFAAAILEDRPPLTTGEEAKAALRLGLAALESIHTEQVIALE